MDFKVIAVLFTTCSWLYVAAMLLMSDWRWNLGRVLQSLLCGGLGVWLLITDRFTIPWIGTLAIMFAVTVIIPGMLRRQARALLLRNRLSAASACFTFAAALTWMRAREIIAAVRELHDIIDLYLSRVEARHYYRHGLPAVLFANSQLSLLSARLTNLVRLQQHRSAVALYQQHFSRGTGKVDSAILFTAALAYGELGRLRDAVACARQAEGVHDTAAPLDVRRFLAHLQIHARSGNPDAVRDLLAGNERLASFLPPAYAHLWLGTALMHAGEPEAAENLFNRALAQLRPVDELLARDISNRLMQLRDGAGQVAISAEIRHALEALRLSCRQAPTPPLAPESNWQPVVTRALIAASIALWLLTEWIGASTDSRTLLHFGANVPQLVQHGQWWRLVTSVFLHVGFMHLVFNAVGCYIFGAFVERTTGRWGMFTTFMLSGIAGSAASAFLGGHIVSAGASGAVLGLLGAAIVIVLRLPGAFSQRMRKIYAFQFFFLAAANLLFGFLGHHIDNLAHAGGFTAGVLCGVILMLNSGTGVRTPAWRLAGYLSAALLASASVGLAHNLLAGGYPRRPPPFREYIGPDGAWRIGVPVFWEVEPAKSNAVTFRDPFGLNLHVSEQSEQGLRALLRQPSAPPAGISRKRWRMAGRNIYHQTLTVWAQEEERTVAAVYQIARGRHWYVLGFRCREEQLSDYLPLIDRILAEFEPRSR